MEQLDDLDAGHQIEISPARYNFQSLNNTALNTSVGSRGFANTNDNTIINNYGYDVHEVHTTGRFWGFEY